MRPVLQNALPKATAIGRASNLQSPTHNADLPDRYQNVSFLLILGNDHDTVLDFDLPTRLPAFGII